MTHLSNRSLATSIPPESWKLSVVTPITKLNPPSSYSDLRPISVTPILPRIFENRFVRKFFLPGIPKRPIIDQYAFRPFGSTIASLVNLFHNVTDMLETDDHVRCFRFKQGF
jgi:hypothetical protein